MSLLDDVSIVVTPNGYKAGTLYGVLPTATLGSEKITNGDLSNGTVGFTPFNSTIANVSNTLEITNTASYGSAGASVLTTIIGKRYEFTADIKGGTSATALMRAGKNPNGVDLLNVTAFPITSTFVKHTFYFVAKTTTSYVSLWSGSPTIGDTVFFDNISVKEWTASDMDVTRATAATRVDENGLVNYAEVLGGELVDNGSFTTDSNWEKSSFWTISGGTASMPSTSSYLPLYQNDVTIAGKTYVLNFEIISITSIIKATSINNGAASGEILLGEYSTIGNKKITFTTQSGGEAIAFARVVGNTSSCTITNISVKEVTRDNVPRIDYTGGGCPHILAEPQRTNLIPYSSDFTVGNWAKTRCTVTSNQATSPDGTLNADLMTSTDDDARLGDQVGSSGAEFTQSIYVKSAQVSDVNCQIDFAGLNTVTFTANQQWQRVETTLTDTSQSPRLRLRILNSGNSIYVWGGQVEQGSYATSYIPTSGSTVTRNQDQFTRDGIGSLINSTEGVLFVEIAALDNNLSGNKIISLSDGTTSNRLLIYYTNIDNTIKWFSQVGGSIQVDDGVVLSDITQFSKIAFKYKLNDYSLWVDGVEVGSYTSGSSFPADTLNILALDDGGGSSKFFGKVKQLQVYKTALTDVQLAALTT